MTLINHFSMVNGPKLSKNGPLITAEELRELMDYNPETGIFSWRGRTPSRRFNWPRAPVSLKQSGRYIRICIGRRMYLAHRLAWLYTFGVWPQSELDHIDRNTKNNAISNLRESSRSDNLRNNSNPYKNNKTGYRGVFFEEKRSLYKAQMSIDGKTKFIGYFQTAEEASKAYQDKLSEITLERKP